MLFLYYLLVAGLTQPPSGALQAISLKRDVTYKASSILVEISALVFVICFQTGWLIS
jgi:hypothetical protein